MGQTKGDQIGLLVREERDGEYYHVVGQVVLLTGENGQTIRNGLDTWADDLEVRCQGGGCTQSRDVYAFAVEYRGVFSVDAAKAKRMHDTLVRVSKGLDKINAARGYTSGFGEFVQRVCEVLKVAHIVVKRTGQDGAMYDDQRFRFMTIGEGRYHVDALIAAWQQPRDPEAVAR